MAKENDDELSEESDDNDDLQFIKEFDKEHTLTEMYEKPNEFGMKMI